MNRPRWHKVIADLWSHRLRSLLVIASILVGLFAIGVIANLYILIDRDMRDEYTAIHPANIFVSTSLYNKQFLDHLENLPGVAQVQGTRQAVVRLQSGPGQWIAVQLVAVPDFDNIQINQVELSEGQWPPADRQIVLEQTKLPRTHASLNGPVTLELPSGGTRQLPLVGIVQDQSLGAGTGGTGGFFSATARGYVTQNTLEWLEQPQPKQLNNVHLVVTGDGTDTAFIEDVSTRVTDELEKNGVSVYGSSVRSSIGHPNEDLVKAMTGVLLVLGLLVVFLSGFLITNTLQALLEQQVQQVGIMKSVGARRIQIVYIYMVLILVYGLLALAISIPLATFTSGNLLGFLAEQLNFSSGGLRLVPEVVILQVILALVVPQVAAFLPIWKGTGISVQEALSGIRQGGGGSARRRGNGSARLRRVSRPVRIAFQNVFRRPGRLALTLITLTAGGAIFIGTFSVKVSMQRTIEQVGRYFLADANLTLERPYRVEKIMRLLNEIPGVRYTEAWASASSQVLLADGTVGEDVQMLAPPADSPLVMPVMITGRWLQPGDHNAIVLNELFLSRYPDMKVGDTLRLQVNGKNTDWEVVGFFRFAGKVTGFLAYTDYAYLTEMIGQVQQALLYRVVMADPNPTPEKQDGLAQVIEATMRQDGILVTEVTPGSSLIGQASGGLGILTSFLLFLAGLIALVGSIGLAGTMSMNVLERTREIGILRAIGATNLVLMKMVIIEGMLIGLISWVMAAFLSFPIGKLISDSITQSVFGAPSQPGYPPESFLIWLGVVILLSVLASVMPARNAARLTIREVLSYE